MQVAAVERRIIGILADRVETAAPFLVGHILSGPQHGRRRTTRREKVTEVAEFLLKSCLGG